MHKLLLPLLLVTMLSAACVDVPISPDPRSYTTQEGIDQNVSEGRLDARAVVASGLYDDLAPENYPFMLIQFYRGVLESYVAEQGLTEEEFLAHPKLRDFMDHHLIPGFVDTIEIRSTQNGRFTYTSAAGSEVVFTTGEDLHQRPDNLNVAFANGVPFSPYCLVSGNGSEGGIENLGIVCPATAPIVKDFDWSE